MVAETALFEGVPAGGVPAGGVPAEEAGVQDAGLWLNEDQQSTWRAVIGVNRLLERSLDRQLQRDAGLPLAYYEILVVLSEAPQRRMRLSDLAGRINFSLSRLSHAVARMETAGWLERLPRASSKREKDACLTAAGVAMLARLAPGHVSLVKQLIFEQLSPGQADQLRYLCELLTPGLLAYSGCDRPESG
jgi:DNA-binding MarR family transcriptional regulator